MHSILFKFFCIVQIVVFVCKPVEPMFPSTSTAALRDLVTRSRSSSPTSSTSSLLSKHQHIETRNPVASSSKSNKNRINQETRLEETERLTRERSNNINLNEAAVQTNVPFSELNPSRDGFFARANRVLARQAASALVGTAIGFGADEILHRMNSTSTITSTTTTEENALVDQ